MTPQQVRIRQYRETDGAAFCEAAQESHKEVFEWLEWCHDGYTRKEADEWVSSQKKLFDEGTVYGDEFTTEEFEFDADEVKLPEDGLECFGVGFAKVADGAVIRCEVAGNPYCVEVGGAGFFQTSAGADTREVSPEVELKERSRAVAGASSFGIFSSHGKS